MISSVSLQSSLVMLLFAWCAYCAMGQSSCSSSQDCGERSYCNAIDSVCMTVGSCVEVADCDDPFNIGYPMVLCLGTKTCENGMCGMDCGPPICQTSEDCMEGSYCNLGTCMEVGSCVELADCNDPTNVGFPMIECIGAQTCTDGKCGIECGKGCTTSDECVGSMYCSSDGICLGAGICSIVEDCSDASNIYPIAACIGNLECNEGRCGMNCSGSDIVGDCLSSRDCMGADEYCALDGMCRESGSCSQPKDCANRDNIFSSIACVGTVTCDNNMCGKICDGQEPLEPEPVPGGAIEACSIDDDCALLGTDGVGFYCGQGECQESGACKTDIDCMNPVNSMWDIKRCAGYTTCRDNGTCDRVCGNTCESGARPADCFENPCNPVPEDACAGAVSCKVDLCDCGAMYFDAAGSVIENCEDARVDNGGAAATTCTTDDDCALLGTDGMGFYCGQGECLELGACKSDNDCMNPTNSLWDIKRCLGYVTCQDNGTCDRVCGSSICKPGAKPVNCFADPCNPDLGDGCPGAVSCISNYCDGGCDAMYYNASGSVIENCEDVAEPVEITKVDNGAADVAKGGDGASEPVDLTAPETVGVTDAATADTNSSSPIAKTTMLASISVIFALCSLLMV